MNAFQNQKKIQNIIYLKHGQSDESLVQNQFLRESGFTADFFLPETNRTINRALIPQNTETFWRGDYRREVSDTADVCVDANVS